MNNTNPAHLTSLVSVVFIIVGLLYSLVGLALFIMVLVNGFKYLFSGVNPELKEQANKGLTFAVIGFVVIVLAYVIIVFIGNLIPNGYIVSFINGTTLHFSLNNIGGGGS